MSDQGKRPTSYQGLTEDLEMRSKKNLPATHRIAKPEHVAMTMAVVTRDGGISMLGPERVFTFVVLPFTGN